MVKYNSFSPFDREGAQESQLGSVESEAQDMCPFCEDGTMEPVEEYSFLEEDEEGPFPLPAEICDSCGEYLLNEENMIKLLEEKDRRKGMGYKRTSIKDGVVKKYSIN